MDYLLPDSWLRDFLKTKATPERIAREVSQSGVSIEKITPVGKDFLYHVEVTTNRVDCASVLGIARESALILKRAGISAIYEAPALYSKQTFTKSVSYLHATVDPKLCPRFTAVLITDVHVGDSPRYIKERLEAVGIRSINTVVDISNYVMIEYGQPVHTYDYDKIVDHTMVLRESKKGEKLTTLDGKVHTLPGGDIVIEDGSKRLIDLAGIMGGENSAIDSTTKNVLVFVQTYDPVHIRRTSMKLAHRTQAAGLFEKGLDTELVGSAIKRCIDLFEGLTGGKAKQQILDIYPKKPAMKKVTVSQDFISLYLGTVLPQKDITTILTSLGFGVTWKGNTLTATVPSWRGNDVSIPEDIVEEIARMYGYHNLPSTLMTGALPPTWPDSPFAHESRIRETLTSLTGVEIYTLSLVSEAMTLPTSLQLSNPLGTDAQYLRQALLPSLFSAANDNVSAKERFFLFELANVYIPVKTKLPLESVHLGGVFSGYSFREAKGVVQALLSQLHISYTERVEDGVLFFESKNDLLGILRLHETFVGFEFDTTILRTHSHETGTFVMPSKYPPHVEDFTFIKPEGVAVGNIISEIKTISLISQVEYIDSYQDAYTFRVWYQDPEKTITNSDVEAIRSKLLSKLESKNITLKG